MQQNLLKRVTIIKRNKYHTIRNFIYLAFIIFCLVDTFILKDELESETKIIFVIFIIIIFVFDFFVKKYLILGKLMLLDFKLLFTNNNLSKEIIFNKNDKIIFYCFDYKNEYGTIIKNLITCRILLEGTNNYIKIIRNDNETIFFRILIKNNKQKKVILNYFKKLSQNNKFNVKIRKWEVYKELFTK